MHYDATFLKSLFLEETLKLMGVLLHQSFVSALHSVVSCRASAVMPRWSKSWEVFIFVCLDFYINIFRLEI